MDESSRGVNERVVTVAEFEAGLGGVLTRLVADPGRWVVLVDVLASEGRYLQFLAREDGVLHAEVSSNASLRGGDRLTGADMAALVEDGWQEPIDADLPNFWRGQGRSTATATAKPRARRVPPATASRRRWLAVTMITARVSAG